MRFAVLVEVKLRPGIADPQGSTIERALPLLGFDAVTGVSVGKAIRFSIEADDPAEALAEVDDLCKRFLTNPVIEDAVVSLEPRDMTGLGGNHVRGTVAVVLFPGTNCELDVVEAVRDLGGNAQIVWHADARLPAGVAAVVLPGGFAHGDYLRTGAIARFSPIMKAVAAFASEGGPVLGICNGFQVLCEAGLLPGALQKNAGLKFQCRTVSVVVENSTTVATTAFGPGETIRVPINHFEGNYTCAPDTLEELRARAQIVFRYEDDVNGSMDRIAGISNEAGNVVGLMPHPERASHALLGSEDGRRIFESLLLADRRQAAGVTTPG